MSVHRARRSAEQLVERLRLQAPPIDVDRIAEVLGLPVVVMPLPSDTSGLLITKAGRSYVCVRSSDPRYRQRFTLAHELGHHHLRHQFQPGDHVHVDRGNFISQRGARAAAGIDVKEIEANQFAASLLMPEMLLKPRAEALGAPDLWDHDVEYLAREFDVSEQAMTIRLTALGLL